MTHTNTPKQYDTRRITLWLTCLAAIGALIATLWHVSAFYLGTHAARAAYFSTTVLVTIIVPAVLAIAGVIAIFIAVDNIESPVSADKLNRIRGAISRETASHYRDVLERDLERAERQGARNGLYKSVVGVAIVTTLIATFWLVQGIRWNNRNGFESTVVYAAELVDTQVEFAPVYESRLSVPQARLQLRQALSGATGQIGDVTYIGNQTTPEYCATVLRSATLGRVWTRQVLCLDPATGATRSADFTGDVGAPDGAWSSKLGDQVAEVRRGLVFDDADVYGYITEDGEARLVVPVRYATGAWNTRYDVAAGVVVFDTDGNREYLAEVEQGTIPGPVMPAAIATRVRASVNALEGFLVHRNPRRSEQTLEPTNTTEGLAATDPNAENPSEFVLVREGRLYYVTPLTPYGQSQTIVGYLEVAADTVSAGTQPQATLYRLDRPQASLQLIVQRVTSLYDADIDWMEANEATDASNRARIYEITPGATGQVTLTIGTGTQTLYRVYVDATLDAQNRFGDICIHRFRDDVQIRCDASDADPTPVGSLRGIASNDTPTVGNGTSAETSGIDLSDVSTQELLDEIARRIGE